MVLILKAILTEPRAPLTQLLDVPLELDIWEVQADYVVLRGAEVHAERLQRMGYRVEQLHMTETDLSTFATADAVAGSHSAETLEQEMRQLAESHPEIAELHKDGRSSDAGTQEPSNGSR